MIFPLVALAMSIPQASRPYYVAANQAAVWVCAQPEPGLKDISLYSGSAGVLVFLSELAHVTKSDAHLKLVDVRATALAAEAGMAKDRGLYTGLSGAAFALDCASRVTGSDKHRRAAEDILTRVAKEANSDIPGSAWGDNTDIVSGTAGVGCTLVWAANAWKRPDLLQVARRAGDRMLEIAVSKGDGSSWAMAPNYPREMPGFSHGTAGVAYFLAQLGQATNEAKYLDAAKRGAAYLRAIGGKDGLIYHHDPGGKDLFYLGWCHGPVGTSRLFATLHRATKEVGYVDWIDAGAATLLQSGLPEKRTPGYWNNYGFCCGDAGMLRFFLDLYRLDNKPEQIAFARRNADFLIARADKADGGLKWTFAENRVSPEKVQAQTGLMQGAAGIGLSLLWLDELERKQDALVRMPDAPWRW